MLKNNFFALAIHIAIGFTTFKLFTFVDSFAIDNKVKFGDLYYNTGAVSIFLFALVLYLLSGRLLCKQETKVKSFLSISGVSIIALCLWLICFIITGETRTGSDWNWIPFIIYIAYAIPLEMTFSIDSPYIAVLFSLMPSVLIWVGILMWNKRKL